MLQIWFQNRRQINRRKSRPLLPHELAAFGLGGIAALSSDPSSAVLFNSSQSAPEAPVLLQDGSTSLKDNIPTGSQVHDGMVPNDQSVESCVSSAQQGAINSSKSCTPSLSQSTSKLGTQSSPESSSAMTSSIPLGESVVKSFSSTPGYLANRWNAPNTSSSTPISAQVTPQVTPSM
jgi:hypothetical protein